MQVNAVVMGLAGARPHLRALLDEEPEADEGYVTLVNARDDESGNLVECAERTDLLGLEAPPPRRHRHLHAACRRRPAWSDVDFRLHAREHQVLLRRLRSMPSRARRWPSLAPPGAGKTTITNLINRFYDIADGKIRYDGININKI